MILTIPLTTIINVILLYVIILQMEVINISTIAFSNNKGGVLKTSMATNIAGVLAGQGNSVLIIDTDSQGNALLSFGRNPDHYGNTLFGVLTDGLACEEAITTVAKGIDVLVSNDDMVEFDFEVISHRGRYPEPFYLLREKCGHIANEYDYVLIDTSPSMSLANANVFSYPDVKIVIPMQCEQYSRRSLVKTLNTIDSFRAKHNPSLSVLGIAPTLFDSRTNIHQEVLQDIRKYGDQNGIPVFDTVVPKSVRYAASVAYNSNPVTISLPEHMTSQVYRELVKEMFNNER